MNSPATELKLFERLRTINEGGEDPRDIISEINSALQHNLNMRSTLGEKGICEIISNTFEYAAPNSANTCLELLKIVYNLCCDGDFPNSEFCIENIVSFGLTGVCKSIVWCIQKYVRNEECVLHGCIAIRALAYDSAQNQEYLFTVGACEVLSGVLVSFSDNLAVCEASCWAIMGLSYHDDIASRFGELGVCKSLYDLLKQSIHLRVFHEEYSKVVTAALWATRNLAAINNLNLNIFDDLGIPDVLLSILILSDSGGLLSEKLYESICGALGGLCYDDKLASTIGSNGLGNLILEKGKQFIENEKIGMVLSEVVRNLTACEDPEANIRLLTDAQGAELLMSLLEKHLKNSIICVMSCRALGNLSLVDDCR